MAISSLGFCCWDDPAVAFSSSFLDSSASRKASSDVSDMSWFGIIWHISMVSISSSVGGQEIYEQRSCILMADIGGQISSIGNTSSKLYMKETKNLAYIEEMF